MEFRTVRTLVAALLLPMQALTLGAGRALDHRRAGPASPVAARRCGGRALAGYRPLAGLGRKLGRRRARRTARDLPLAARLPGSAEDRYDAAKHCHASAKGDCIVAELERLKTELRCAPTDDR